MNMGVAAQPASQELLKFARWRNVGPANMMGRISSVDGWERDWRVQLVGAASGGVWKTVNGGITFEPIFESYATKSIGAVAFFQADPTVVWVGTDDGLVHVTRDGGTTWTDVSEGLPGGLWTSRVEASRFEEAGAYVSLDGHWVGDTKPYVFRTDNWGATWTDIGAGIPSEVPGNSVHTVVEDRVNPALLFVGTEFGCFATLDGGASWHRFMNGLPPVAVHDLVIHPRTNDLVAGTHGRSVWIADDITPLQQLSYAVLAAEAHLFEPPVATKWRRFPKGRVETHFLLRGENPPYGAAMHWYLRDAGSVELESSGATEAGVPEFMDFTLADRPDMQLPMRGGLAWLDRRSMHRFGRRFVELSDAERNSVLDEIAWPDDAVPDVSQGVAFFSRFRDLTASGFWSSKTGVADLRYMGNTFVREWKGCPQEVLDRLGVAYED